MSIREFDLIYNNKKNGVFQATTPAKAGLLAFKFLYNKLNCHVNEEILFSLIEKNKNVARIFYYIGIRRESDKPYTYTVAGKTITYKYRNIIRKNRKITIMEKNTKILDNSEKSKSSNSHELQNIDDNKSNINNEGINILLNDTNMIIQNIDNAELKNISDNAADDAKSTGQYDLNETDNTTSTNNSTEDPSTQYFKIIDPESIKYNKIYCGANQDVKYNVIATVSTDTESSSNNEYESSSNSNNNEYESSSSSNNEYESSDERKKLYFTYTNPVSPQYVGKYTGNVNDIANSIFNKIVNDYKTQNTKNPDNIFINLQAESGHIYQYCITKINGDDVSQEFYLKDYN